MRIALSLLLFFSIFLSPGKSYAGGQGLIDGFDFLAETDTTSYVLFAPFDLRNRESYFQVTNQDSNGANIHVQVYDVSNLCNENDFFDNLTSNDTHVYNLRDIATNDGSPSGIVLPDNAYGIVVISVVRTGFVEIETFAPIFGNIRILDNLGYEYRTNAQSFPSGRFPITLVPPTASFNFNSSEGVILSDVFGIPMATMPNGSRFSIEANIDDVLNAYAAVDIDIVNNNEVLFSCRDVIFACIDENSPLQEELLLVAGEEFMGGGGGASKMSARTSANVARFEYGINNAIPHSKGGELLCPGNNISEGTVIVTLENLGLGVFPFAMYVGLNNGNGRGSMDAIFAPNILAYEECFVC